MFQRQTRGNCDHLSGHLEYTASRGLVGLVGRAGACCNLFVDHEEGTGTIGVFLPLTVMDPRAREVDTDAKAHSDAGELPARLT